MKYNNGILLSSMTEHCLLAADVISTKYPMVWQGSVKSYNGCCPNVYATTVV